MRVTERTLYRPIMNQLRCLSCSWVDEVSSNGYPDIVFTEDKVGVVLQVKIGEVNLLERVAEVERHARELGYENKVVIVYPGSVRREIAEPDQDLIEQLALDEIVKAISLTEFLTDRIEAPGAEVLERIVNSVYFWAQLFFHKEESTGRRIDIRGEDLAQIRFPDVSSLADRQLAPLLSVFEELGKEQFPSLIEQLETGCEGRLAIDRAVLQCLGVTTVSDDDLRDIYKVLYDEMDKTRRLRKN